MPGTAELAKFYNGFSFLPPDLEYLDRDLAAVRQSLEYQIGRRKERSTFLDYGGGCGLYAKAAKSLGWEVSLFDYDPVALDFASTKLGIDNIVDRMSEFDDGSFDLIWGFHVVEHWRKIEEEFSEIDRILKPGGKLIIATPNARSWEKYFRLRHFFGYWKSWRARGLGRWETAKLLLRFDSVFCWDPPRHLYAFTPSSLKKIAERFGYEVLVRESSNLDSRFEPRRYVVPYSEDLLRPVVSCLKRRPWSLGLWKELARILFEYGGLTLAGRVFSEGGEQLYGVFRKPL